MQQNFEQTSNSFAKNSTPGELDRVLGELQNEDRRNDIEREIFIHKSEVDRDEDDKNEMATGKKSFKDLAWYVEIFKKPVLFLAGLEILVYILAIVPALETFMFKVAEPLLLIVDFVIFGWLVVIVKLQKEEGWWQVGVTNFLAGFALGAVVSIFKLIWLREYWTIFNLITEPVFMGLVALIIGLVSSLFIKKK